MDTPRIDVARLRTVAFACIAAGAALVAVGNGVGWRRAEARARGLEAEALRAQGYVVAAEASNRELTSKLGALRQQVDELKAAGVAKKVDSVLTWRTAPARVTVTASAPPASLGAPGPAAGDPVGVPGESSPNAPEQVALELDVRGREARLETREGNQMLVGEVEVWQTDVDPDALLATLPYDVDATDLVRATRPRVRRWGAGPVLGLTGGKVALGAIVAAPEAEVFGGRIGIRPFASLLAAPDGEASISGGVLFTF